MARHKDEGRLPDFVGIGAMRSGSAWLYQCLIAHPEIAAPQRKELHFFDSGAYDKGIRHYAAAFRGCPIDRIAGEFSPSYMFVPAAAARIRRWLPQVRLLACLRNPVQRAFSHYRFAVQMQGRLSFHPTFEDALDHDAELVGRGMYGEQLERYYELFPSDNILVLLHDDTRADPAATLRRLYRFVGVADTSFIPPQTFQQVNQVGGFDIVERLPVANRALYALRHRLPAGGVLERLAAASGAAALARRVIRANRTRVAPTPGRPASRPDPVLRPDTAARLAALYREDAERLGRLLGRDIPWMTGITPGPRD